MLIVLVLNTLQHNSTVIVIRLFIMGIWPPNSIERYNQGFFLHMHRSPLAYEVFDRPVLPSAQPAGHFCPLCGLFPPKRPIFVEKGHFLLKKRFCLKSGLNRPKSNEFLAHVPDTIFPVAPLFLSLQANILRTGQYAGMPSIWKKTLFCGRPGIFW